MNTLVAICDTDGDGKISSEILPSPSEYPSCKKMDEVTGWLKDSDLPATIRGQPGVSDVEVSFCPGLRYLGVRYIFADLEDMKNFLGSDKFGELAETVSAHEHFDASREPLEFKGFFLKGV